LKHYLRFQDLAGAFEFTIDSKDAIGIGYFETLNWGFFAVEEGNKMASVNKAILVGRLGADPVKRYTSSGNPVVSFRIATTEGWTNREGEREERTEWHQIVAWSKLAEICDQYLTKGRLVYVEGRIQTREWEDREGNRRWTTEIIANQMQMLGPPTGEAPRDVETDDVQPEPPEPVTDSDDDIPF